MTDEQQFQEWKRKQNATQTTEATGKVWKLSILSGGLTFFASMGLMSITMGGIEWSDGIPLSFILCAIGIVAGIGLYVGGKLGAWWYHG